MTISNIFITGIFCLYIIAMLIINLITPDKANSILENRKLASFPKFNKEEFFDGEYTQKLETYITDQFVFRDNFIELKSLSETLLGKHENNGVYITLENTLIDKFPKSDYSTVDQNIKALNNFNELISVPMNFVIIPTQNDIYSYKLPSNAPLNSQKDMIDYTYGKLSDTINSIDVYEKLLSKKEEYIFYNTDHHWTSLGAYYAYEEIMQNLDKDYVNISTLEKTTLSTDFNGTIFSKSGVRYVIPDIIDVYISNKEIDISDANGTRTEMLYNLEKLETNDKYEVFLGGNDPVVTIKGTGLGNLLLIKDSFSNSLAPFLSESYENIHLVDLRFMKMPMSDYIIDNNITDVLICYSASSFEADNNLIFLR